MADVVGGQCAGVVLTGEAVVTMAGTRRYDLPEADAFTRAYWDAAAEGRLLIRRCGDCGRAHHYPGSSARTAGASP